MATEGVPCSSQISQPGENDEGAKVYVMPGGYGPS